MRNKTVQGYEIKQAVVFDNNKGFAFAENPKAVQPFVTWQLSDNDGNRDFYWGHYFTNKDTAVLDFEKRVSTYKKDYPTLGEKHNYPGCMGEQRRNAATSLAAAEMSEEDNYNMIDGIPNNTKKPSITQQLREYESKQAEYTAKKTRKSAEQER